MSVRVYYKSNVKSYTKTWQITLSNCHHFTMKGFRISTSRVPSTTINTHAKSLIKNCRPSAAAKSHLASRNAEMAQQRAARASAQSSFNNKNSGNHGGANDISPAHVKLIEKYRYGGLCGYGKLWFLELLFCRVGQIIQEPDIIRLYQETWYDFLRFVSGK